MAYDNANTYETIELFGLTEKDAQLPIPEDHFLTDRIIRESFEALLGSLRGTGLEAEIEPLAHGLATILQRRKVALGKEVDRTADKIGALAKSHDGSEIAETASKRRRPASCSCARRQRHRGDERGGGGMLRDRDWPRFIRQPAARASGRKRPARSSRRVPAGAARPRNRREVESRGGAPDRLRRHRLDRCRCDLQHARQNERIKQNRNLESYSATRVASMGRR